MFLEFPFVFDYFSDPYTLSLQLISFTGGGLHIRIIAYLPYQGRAHLPPDTDSDTCARGSAITILKCSRLLHEG